MGILEAAGVVAAVVSTIISAGSLVFAALPYLKRPDRFYMDAAQSLSSIRATNEALREYDDGREAARKQSTEYFQHLYTWMAYGDIILPFVRKKIISRLVSLLVLFVGASWTIPLDFHDRLLALPLGSVEVHDILILALVIGLSLANLAREFFSKFLLSQNERSFLRAYDSLLRTFYAKNVLPVIEDFNKECATFFALHPQGDQEESTYLKSKVDTMRRKVEAISDILFPPSSDAP